MNEIAAALLAVSLLTGLPVPFEPKLVETREEMPCIEHQAKKPLGLYCMGHIWLADKNDFETLVHEVVHHYQFAYPAEMRERQSYNYQRKWKDKQ